MKKAGILLCLLGITIFLTGCTQQQVKTISIVSTTPAHPVFPENITITWNVHVEGNKTASATALYYDTRSHPGVLDPTTMPEEAGYALHTNIQQGTIPNNFHETVPAQPADYLFFRAHVRIDKVNYWTSEYRIPVGKV